MVERALDVTCPLGESVLFFIARLRSYPNWEQSLTQSKVVNAGWVREVCASLIKDEAAPFTYYAHLRGQELEISPATVTQALNILEVYDHYILDRTSIVYLTWDVIARELSGKRMRHWDGRRFPDFDLTPDYHMLHLAL